MLDGGEKLCPRDGKKYTEEVLISEVTSVRRGQKYILVQNVECNVESADTVKISTDDAMLISLFAGCQYLQA